MNPQNKERTPRIGDVYLMRFAGDASEQTGWRPGLVFQNNIGNVHSPNIIALPLTSSIKKIGAAHPCGGERRQQRSAKGQHGSLRKP